MLFHELSIAIAIYSYMWSYNLIASDNSYLYIVYCDVLRI